MVAKLLCAVRPDIAIFGQSINRYGNPWEWYWLALAVEFLYAAWTLALFWLIAPLAWLLTALMPRPRRLVYLTYGLESQGVPRETVLDAPVVTADNVDDYLDAAFES